MFHLTLASNSSQKFFPNNTTTHFTTKLPQTVTLNEEYEVGVNEIQIPVSWYNVTENECWFKTSSAKIFETGHRGSELPRSIHVIKAGFYKKTEVLLQHMNDLITELLPNRKKLVYFSKDNVSKRVRILVKKGTLLLSFALARLLGFEAQHFSIGEYFSDSVTDLAHKYHTVFVYTDLIRPRIFGDSMVPLLATIPVKAEHGNMVSKRYNRIDYYPLQARTFSTVEIDLRTDTGDQIPFEFGRVIVSLHFRKRNVPTL